MQTAQVIFTGSGSEANNLALHAFASATGSGHRRRDGTSQPAAGAESTVCPNPGCLPALPSGQHDWNVGSVAEEIYAGGAPGGQVSLVSLMLGNNETGVVNDLSEVVRLCRRYGVPVHSDIVQAVGKIEFDMTACGLSAVTLAAHKLHGPVGIGGLVLAEAIAAAPLVVGGGQQLGWRAGTEPVVLAAGLAIALQLADEARRAGAYAEVARLRDQFEAGLCNELERIAINGSEAPRLPQTSNLAFGGADRQALQMALDLAGVACSTGSACASGSSRPSPTLVAMGLEERRIASSLRFSLSRLTTPAEIDNAVDRIAAIVHKLRFRT